MNPGTGLFVQVTLTQPQAELLSEVLGFALTQTTADEGTQLEQLYSFFAFVAEHPRSFPPRGAMAKSIKTRMRMLRRAHAA